MSFCLTLKLFALYSRVTRSSSSKFDSVYMMYEAGTCSRGKLPPGPTDLPEPGLVGNVQVQGDDARGRADEEHEHPELVALPPVCRDLPSRSHPRC